ncbi:uncharacterized protein LOC125850472 [Solanum stenotomum]|uniref:uncharacterized protein LOC125850472 n=1 Tax=Solanum stenotomum TaxID=172797 RepID=UPI0020CFF8A7|nr:uncharacterized protein LOC125850472 [Solanum stenotomum]
MSPRRVVSGRPGRINVKEKGVPNALEVQLQEEVTKVEFCEAIRMLSQVATYQVKQRDNRQEVTDISRIRELLRINPPSFTGSSVTEDPENFIEELKRLFDVIRVANEERVKLAVYQMKSVTRIWFDKWKKNRVEHAPVVSWAVFESALMGRFFPLEKDKPKKREEFKNKRAKTSGNQFRQQKSNAKRSFSQQKQKGPAPPSASEPAPRNKFAPPGRAAPGGANSSTGG